MAKTAYGRTRRRTFLMALYIAIIASMVLGTTLQAAEPQGETASPDAVSADDGGAWELGVEGTAGNLTTATAAERLGMWVWLNGWFVRRFSFNEASSWEQDFKKASRGGTEDYYLDNVDLMFYVGHGAPGLFTFDNASHDDSTLNAPIDCSASWGDKDNEWLALTSCQVLSGSGLSAMAQCMNRQHLILGFVTNASAHNSYWNTQAYHFGRYMRYGYNMTQSWFKGCDVAQRGRVARVIAEETSCFNDNPYYGSVCADVLDNDYYWYTHSCGTASASALPLDIFQLELPIYKVDPYSTADAERDFTNLSGVFGVPNTAAVQLAAMGEDTDPPGAPADNPFLVSSTTTETLEVDSQSGIYTFSNLDQLWSENAAEQAMALSAASVNYISQNDARTIADNFLNNNGLMPSDAVFYEVAEDTTGQIGRATLANGMTIASAEDIEQAEVPANMQVIYTRILTVPVATTAGIQQEMEFVVVGPGAKQKVYLPTTAPVSAAGVVQEVDPLGVQGGWRSASIAVNAATGQALTASIYNSATAESLYDALGDNVTMNSLPMDIKSYDVLSATLAYWENAPGASQGELIPVYELTTLFTLQDDSTTQDFLYIPASSIYLNPLAKILDAPAKIDQLDLTLTLTAEDATKTLQAAGIGGDQFPFVMGYAGAGGTYLYEWYVNSVDEANKLTDLNTSDGATKITFNLPGPDDEHISTLDIILVVKDIDSPNESSATAIAQIPVDPALYMPALEVAEATP